METKSIWHVPVHGLGMTLRIRWFTILLPAEILVSSRSHCLKLSLHIIELTLSDVQSFSYPFNDVYWPGRKTYNLTETFEPETKIQLPVYPHLYILNCLVSHRNVSNCWASFIVHDNRFSSQRGDNITTWKFNVIAYLWLWKSSNFMLSFKQVHFAT